MPATTPVYGFPYPLGNDQVQAGDNDIRALAEKVEATLSTGRYWFTRKGTDQAGFGASGQAMPIPLAGAPSGALILIQSVLVVGAPATAPAAMTVWLDAGANAARDHAQASSVHTIAATTHWAAIAAAAVIRATAASPAASLMLSHTGSTVTISQQTYAVATRIA